MFEMRLTAIGFFSPWIAQAFKDWLSEIEKLEAIKVKKGEGETIEVSHSDWEMKFLVLSVNGDRTLFSLRFKDTKDKETIPNKYIILTWDWDLGKGKNLYVILKYPDTGVSLTLTTQVTSLDYKKVRKKKEVKK